MPRKAWIRFCAISKVEDNRYDFFYQSTGYRILLFLLALNIAACTWKTIRRNLAAVREVVPLVVTPEYGYSCVADCAGLGASAQEIMVALCRRKVAVYPGDGLGEVGATTTIRLNLSDPSPSAVERFARAWPDAVVEAATGVYREPVQDFFRSTGTERGRRLAELVGGGAPGAR